MTTPFLNFSFTSSDFERAIAAAAPGIVLRGQTELGFLAEAIAENGKHRINYRTGETRKTVEVRRGIDARGPYFAVGSWNSAGLWIEFGTRAHNIEVRNAKVLTDGVSVFGRKVRHPGTAPNPWLRPAITEEVLAWHAASAFL